MKTFLYLIISFLLVYVAFGFVSMNWNVFTWASEARLLMVFFAPMITFYIGLVRGDWGP